MYMYTVHVYMYIVYTKQDGFQQLCGLKPLPTQTAKSSGFESQPDHYFLCFTSCSLHCRLTISCCKPPLKLSCNVHYSCKSTTQAELVAGFAPRSTTKLTVAIHPPSNFSSASDKTVDSNALPTTHPWNYSHNGEYKKM